MESVFVATCWVSSGVICVGTVLDEGYLWILVDMDLTLLLTGTWCFVDLQTCGLTLTERAHAVLWFE